MATNHRLTQYVYAQGNQGHCKHYGG